MATVAELAVAGLLHDIGKFFQRAHAEESPLSESTRRREEILCPLEEGGERRTHRHLLWTYEFVDSMLGELPRGLSKPVVLDLSVSHHRPGSLGQLLLQKADVLAWGGGEQAPDGAQELAGAVPFRSIRLTPIFEELDIGLGPVKRGHGQEMTPLVSPGDRLLPRPPAEDRSASEDLTPSYRALWDAFVSELKGLPRDDTAGFVAGLQELLLRYAWCVPAAPASAPDVSLYEHSRAVAAIAAALGRYHGETYSESALNRGAEEKFFLVTGSLTGEGRLDAGDGAGSSLAALRARSVRLSLICEMAARRVMGSLSMPACNLLTCDGDRFLILAPRFPEAEEILANQAAVLDAWSLAETQGQLRVCLSWVRVRQDEIADFGALAERYRQAEREARCRPLAGQLIAGDGWNVSRFAIESDSSPQAACERCRRLPAETGAAGGAQGSAGATLWPEGQSVRTPCPSGQGVAPPSPAEGLSAAPRLCGSCATDERLVSKLSASVGAEFFVDERPCDGSAFGWRFKLLAAGDRPDSLTEALLWEAPAASAGTPGSAARVRTLVQYDSGLTPAQMAEKSEGKTRVGYLRIDVDRLFDLLARGFKGRSTAPGRSILPRYLALDRAVDLYMSSRLGNLLRARQPWGSAVFAGGDDALVAGPWDKILEFALALQRDFTAYACRNPNATMSAGLAIASPGEPPASGWRHAEEALRRAKETPAMPGGPSRNQIELFGVCVPWEDVPRVLQRARALTGWVSRRRVPVHLVKVLLRCGRMYRLYRHGGDLSALRFVPLLSNQIRRHLHLKGDAAGQEVREYFQQLVESLDHPDLLHLEAVAACALTAYLGTLAVPVGDAD